MYVYVRIYIYTYCMYIHIHMYTFQNTDLVVDEGVALGEKREVLNSKLPPSGMRLICVN